jgi:hypothetical protein
MGKGAKNMPRSPSPLAPWIRQEITLRLLADSRLFAAAVGNFLLGFPPQSSDVAAHLGGRYPAVSKETGFRLLPDEEEG